MQDREERWSIRQRCAPPTRTLYCCDGNPSIGYGPLLYVHIRRDTRVAPIDGVVGPGTRGYTNSGTKGEPRHQDYRLTKHYAWTC